MNLSKLKNLRRKKNTSATRKMIAICALSLAGSTVHAQQGFDVGLRGIVQTSSLLNGTDQAAGNELNYKNKVSGGGGIGVGYNFNNHVGVGLDILYSKQGQGYTGNSADIDTNGNSNGIKILSQEFQAMAQSKSIAFSGSYTANIALSCIKIPILFRYTGDATKKWYFSSFIGPQINMLNGVTFQVNGSSADLTAYNVSSKDLYKKMTMDAVLGLGVGINLSDNLVLGVHLRLDYGLSDAEDKNATISFLGPSTKIYDPSRAATHNATGGGLISLNYKFIKKAKPAGAPAPAAKKK